MGSKLSTQEVSIRSRWDCRLCGGMVEEKLKLKDTPIANNFTKNPNEGEFYPLELVQCVDCGHVQTGHVVTGVFNGYRYRTPNINKPRLDEAAAKLKARYPNAKTVLEIGANNGLYLESLGKNFEVVVGVDPSGDFPVWPMPFNMNTAKAVARRIGDVDLVVANNVLAHIDDLDTVFCGINYLQAKNVVLEFQYFQNMVRDGIYDTIYHEHLDQHTLAPLIKFFQRYGFKIDLEEELDVHGGSLRLHLARKSVLGIGEVPVDWDSYKKKIAENQKDFLDRLPDRFCLLGAPAKATTLIHQLGIKDRIAYCVDNTPQKQGLYLPGTAIKILPDFAEKLPVVLAAWNYKGDLSGEYITPYRIYS